MIQNSKNQSPSRPTFHRLPNPFGQGINFDDWTIIYSKRLKKNHPFRIGHPRPTAQKKNPSKALPPRPFPSPPPLSLPQRQALENKERKGKQVAEGKYTKKFGMASPHSADRICPRATPPTYHRMEPMSSNF